VRAIAFYHLDGDGLTTAPASSPEVPRAPQGVLRRLRDRLSAPVFRNDA
jgi:hypothetical protein